MKSMIFSAPMVRAILEGRKTQTRRVIKPQPEKWVDCFKPSMNPSTWISSGPFIQDKSGFLAGKPLEIRSNGGSFRCPFKVGDRFYVRETWRPCLAGGVSVEYKAGGRMEANSNSDLHNSIVTATYCRTPAAVADEELRQKGEKGIPYMWHSPIHMPEWAARIHCEITDVRTQRVQEITKDDVIAEGMQIPVRESETPDKVVPYLRITGKCEPPYKWPQKPVESDYYRHEFAFCWDEINGPGSWDANPFVWAYTFRRIEKGGAS